MRRRHLLGALVLTLAGLGAGHPIIFYLHLRCGAAGQAVRAGRRRRPCIRAATRSLVIRAALP